MPATQLKCELSWSASRAREFERCRREYWYSRYASWGWWQEKPRGPRYEVMVHKNLTSLPAFAGDCVHRAIARWFELRRSGTQMSAEELFEEARELFRDGWRQSAGRRLAGASQQERAPGGAPLRPAAGQGSDRACPRPARALCPELLRAGGAGWRAREPSRQLARRGVAGHLPLPRHEGVCGPGLRLRRLRQPPHLGLEDRPAAGGGRIPAPDLRPLRLREVVGGPRVHRPPRGLSGRGQREDGAGGHRGPLPGPGPHVGERAGNDGRALRSRRRPGGHGALGAHRRLPTAARAAASAPCATRPPA